MWPAARQEMVSLRMRRTISAAARSNKGPVALSVALRRNLVSGEPAPGRASDEGDGGITTSRQHWDDVWDRADPDRVSWFQPRPDVSVRLIESSGVGLEAALIDVGGGASVLTCQLLDAGYQDLTVLDISAAGLAAGRRRLDKTASRVQWIQADVREFRPSKTYDLWHDRAVFHFLVRPEDRAAYLDALEYALASDGHIIVATFGPEGPTRCSGLEVRRYSEAMLAEELGPGFRLEEAHVELHTTPRGGTQQFLYAWLSRGS